MLKNLDKIKYFSLKEELYLKNKNLRSANENNNVSKLTISLFLILLFLVALMFFSFNLKNEVIDTQSQFVSNGTYEHYKKMLLYMPKEKLDTQILNIGIDNYSSLKKLREESILDNSVHVLKNLNDKANTILNFSNTLIVFLLIVVVFMLMKINESEKYLFEKMILMTLFIMATSVYISYSTRTDYGVTNNLYILDGVFKISLISFFVIISMLTSVCYKAINSGNSLFSFRKKKAIEKTQSKAYNIMENMDKELSKLNANPKLLKELNDYAALTKNETERIQILILFEELKEQDLRDGIQDSKRVNKHLENKAYINSITPQKREEPVPEEGFFKKIGLFQKENLA